MDESKIHIKTPMGEVVVRKSDLDPAKWMTFEKTGLRAYTLWVHPQTGASVALLDFPEGSGVPDKHTHASNQFMYCLEGEYEYTDSKIVLRPGDFYMNPKDHPHGPTRAHKRSLLLELYDGPHYYEAPSYHTKDTIGKVVDRKTGKEIT
jgi:2,4'-dihydroxyacetophenone dioxygenase